MTIEYVSLADYVAIAVEVTGLDVATVLRVAKLDLADSALHSPAAGFGDTEFYPEFVEKAAVLIVHLAKNHPFPDVNKRAAWVTLRVFVEQRLAVDVRVAAARPPRAVLRCQAAAPHRAARR